MRHLPSKDKSAHFSVFEKDDLQFHLVTDAQHLFMAVLFIASAFAIYHFLQVTLISLLDASQLVVLFGLTGFLLSYLVRKRFGLSILDGLYYNTFVIAPIATVLFFFINASCNDTYSETHNVIGFAVEGKGYTLRLEDDAYDEFWRLRNIDSSPVRKQTPKLKLTFCDGFLGYKVTKARQLE